MPAAIRAAVACAAIAAAAAAWAGDGTRTPERPVEIRARTVSGTTFAGTVTSWDAAGLAGSFGERAWADLPAAELRRVFMQLMERDAAADWLLLGELLAAAPDGARPGDDAFLHARRRGAAAADLEAARARAAAARAAREERERTDRERRLGDAASPVDAPAGPWPVLTDAERAAAVESVRREAAAALAAAGIAGQTVESGRFILCGDLPRADMERLAAQLEAMYALAARMLAVPPDGNLFWGKAAVLCFDAQDTFRVVEAAAFRHRAPDAMRGACHLRGPAVTVSAWRGGDATEFAATLVREALQGLVHRCGTPVALPGWAGEGFADWVARECVPGSRVDASRRTTGLRFFRQGGNALDVMALDRADGSWPGPDAVGHPVGYLLVDLMIAERPAGFGAWVRAVKGGKPWRQALAEDFGADAAHLAASAARWYRVNDGAPRPAAKR
jgi:hypothetical protein